ncbi:MAG: hypothetical protein RI542_08770, partial [Wenzhouxiangella sp.]|nr:hypothetical protein [Wenzhouxiangella sp.]
ARDGDDNDQVVNHAWVAEFGTDDSADNDRAANVSALLALDAVLMANSLSNEYVTDATAGAQTEWVVTMPTKKFRADTQMHPATGDNATGVPLQPFTRRFDKDDGACEDMSFTYWDREEQSNSREANATPPVVSPAPPAGAPAEVFSLCREANVIRFASDGSYPDATGILKEPKRADTPHGYTNFDLEYSEGWVSLDLVNVPADSTVFDTFTKRQTVAVDEINDLKNASVAADFKVENRDVYEGLPVIGFAVSSYTNGNLGDGVLANYGSTFQNRTSRSIVSS